MTLTKVMSDKHRDYRLRVPFADQLCYCNISSNLGDPYKGNEEKHEIVVSVYPIRDLLLQNLKG